MQNEQAKTAAAYIRVSTDDQLEFSPDSQLRSIQAYAAQHAMLIPASLVFVDEGISGRKAEKRPGFQRMIATAKAKPRPFDVILVWKFSRFARNREDSIVYKSMLRKTCGIDVISVSEQLGEDKTAILVEALLEAMDEYYSVNLAEEVCRGMQEKFSRGGVVSPPPFGYRMTEDGFVPREAAASVVQLIFTQFLAGAGLRQIACTLNETGVRTTKDNPFSARTISYILTNPVYLGKLRRHGLHPADGTQLVDGAHPPLITEAQFDAAAEKLAAQKRLAPYTRDTDTDFPLRGLLRCSACGATLVRTMRGTTLQCHRYAKGSCAVSHSISLAKLTNAVWQQLIADFADETVTIRFRAAPPKSEALVDALCRREEQRLSRVKAAFEAGVDTLEEYRARKAEILARLTALSNEKPQERPMPHACALRLSVPQLLALTDRGVIPPLALNRMLHGVLEKIVLYRPENEIALFYRTPDAP